ncbi:DUF2513 domain-containing protein [Yersinia sp. Marseille-Q3913]|uniref:DUF2513 domain-containing protein n=1 Tax=Yersinia sp. Marseille-Q3913 TaxID=2830769 RepID=UPI001BB081DA|nr:DUF2513 domain-containing protein [Yersinia sp. Marseille-Q3913]MBS0054436.1 DUF2513 domain-containing protein [Yersinia sp. Marseille-Q3913]
MKIDHEYLRNLLEAFESSERPETNINELELKGFDSNENFVFHMRLMDDQKLICRTDGRPGFGLASAECDDDDGGYDWAVFPLRLTSDGHDFIDALRNQDVWNTIKVGFKDASMGTLTSVAKELAAGYLKKKISSYLDS